MVMESVARRMGTSIKGSIAMAYDTATVVVRMEMAIGTRVVLSMTRKMGSGILFGQMDRSLKGNGNKTNHMV